MEKNFNKEEILRIIKEYYISLRVCAKNKKYVKSVLNLKETTTNFDEYAKKSARLFLDVGNLSFKDKNGKDAKLDEFFGEKFDASLDSDINVFDVNQMSSIIEQKFSDDELKMVFDLIINNQDAVSSVDSFESSNGKITSYSELLSKFLQLQGSIDSNKEQLEQLMKEKEDLQKQNKDLRSKVRSAAVTKKFTLLQQQFSEQITALQQISTSLSTFNMNSSSFSEETRKMLVDDLKVAVKNEVETMFVDMKTEFASLKEEVKKLVDSQANGVTLSDAERIALVEDTNVLFNGYYTNLVDLFNGYYTNLVNLSRTDRKLDEKNNKSIGFLKDHVLNVEQMLSEIKNNVGVSNNISLEEIQNVITNSINQVFGEVKSGMSKEQFDELKALIGNVEKEKTVNIRSLLLQAMTGNKLYEKGLRYKLSDKKLAKVKDDVNNVEFESMGYHINNPEDEKKGKEKFYLEYAAANAGRPRAWALPVIAGSIALSTFLGAAGTMYLVHAGKDTDTAAYVAEQNEMNQKLDEIAEELGKLSSTFDEAVKTGNQEMINNIKEYINFVFADIDLDKLSNEHSEIIALIGQIESLENENEQNKIEIENLKTQLKEALASDEQNTTLISSLMAQIFAFEKQSSDKDKEIENLEKQLEEALASGSDEKYIKGLLKQIDDLKSDNTEKQLTIDGLNSDISELNDEIERLKKALEEAGESGDLEEVERLQAELKEVQAELDECKKEKADLQSENSQLKKDKKELNDRIDALNKTVNELNESLNSKNTVISQLNKQVIDLNNQLEEAIQRIAELEAESSSEELEAEIKRLEAIYNNASSIVSSLLGSKSTGDLTADLNTLSSMLVSNADELSGEYTFGN